MNINDMFASMPELTPTVMFHPLGCGNTYEIEAKVSGTSLHLSATDFQGSLSCMYAPDADSEKLYVEHQDAVNEAVYAGWEVFKKRPEYQLGKVDYTNLETLKDSYESNLAACILLKAQKKGMDEYDECTCILSVS